MFGSLLRAEQEIGFVEKFALAQDRAAVLKELVAGTEDYYFYHALHFQNTGKQAELKTLLEEWTARTKESSLRKEIQRRQALLIYETDPKATLAYLTEALNLQFNHNQEVPNAKPNLPAKLDPALIARDVFLKQAMDGKEDLNGLQLPALESLLRDKVPLTPTQRRYVLRKLERPDLPGLQELVLADLQTKASTGFGEFPLHENLLIPQLETLSKAKPDLLLSTKFIHAWLRKLQPSEEVNLATNTAAREQWLTTAYAFVKPLAATFNSLKAHVLYHRLDHDWRRGKPTIDLLQAYLALPWSTPHLSTFKANEQTQPSDYLKLGGDFQAITGFPNVGADDELVRNYLLHFLAGAKPVPDLDQDVVKSIFAEANLTAGTGDEEKLASMVTPAEIERLRDRVDIDFAPTNPLEFAPDQAVALDLFIKNVPHLAVQIFELNTLNYYRGGATSLDPGINLDGLIPNLTQQADYAEPPMRRMSRHFAFPELGKKRGVWVIDFMGNGKSNRALIRKGKLKVISRVSAAGTAITVLDEALQPIPQATALVGGQEFKIKRKVEGDVRRPATPAAAPTGAAPGLVTSPSTDFEIFLPFSSKPGPQPIIVTDGAGFAQVETVNLAGEEYSLRAGFHVPMESLVSGHKATVAIRPSLFINQTPIDISLLEEVKLTVSANNHDGTETSVHDETLKLKADAEATYEFTVPERLASLHFKLEGKITSLTTGGKLDLHAETSVSVAENLSEAKIHSRIWLTQIDGSYFIERLGLSGEPLAGEQCEIGLYHGEFTNVVKVNFTTDARGMGELGAMQGIQVIEVASGGHRANFLIPHPKASSSNGNVIQVTAGQPIVLPWLSMAEKPSAPSVSLLERNRGLFVKDVLSDKTAKVKSGYLVLNSLPPGDYSLRYGEPFQTYYIQVSSGKNVATHLLGEARTMDAAEFGTLQIISTKLDPGQLEITLGGAGPEARLHLLASRFVPEFDGFESIGELIGPPPNSFSPWTWDALPTSFLPSRTLDAEYRYVMERRGVKKFPGNMLPRPGLLLNPMATGETTTQDSGFGQGVGPGHGLGFVGMLPPAMRSRNEPSHRDPLSFDLSFLTHPGVTMFNLKPDKDGKIIVKRAALNDAQFIRLLAMDNQSSIERNLSLPAAKTEVRDLRFTNGLNPKAHFAMHNEISILPKDVPVTIPDVSNTHFEVMEDLGKVFNLYETLNEEARLHYFDWLPKWPTLKPERQRELYSQYACHELNFFLQRKDPEFFKVVILPYLKNKRDQTFLDHYLLGDDLKSYLTSWNYRQLNTLERILLGQRHPEEAAATAREIRELWENTTPDVAQLGRMFDAALGGSALTGGSAAEMGVAAAAYAAPDASAFAEQGSANMLKLRNTNLPLLSFDKASIEEVISFLRSKSIELDNLDPNKAGVNFILDTKGRPTAPITLELRDVPLIVALDQVCSLAGLSYRVDPHAVIISSLDGSSNSLETRVFKVAPNFLGTAGGDGSGMVADPFAPATVHPAKRGPPPTAKEVLSALGANFEALGSSATYLPGSNRLIVKNTLQQLDFIDKITDDLGASKAPNLKSPTRGKLPSFSPPAAADPFAAPEEKLSEAETIKRLQRIENGKKLEADADRMMADGDYEGALKGYRAALGMYPNAPMSAEDRARTVTKFSNASVKQADKLGKNGRFDEGKNLLAEALDFDNDNGSVKTLLKRLDDPDYYNPSMTDRHYKNTEEVAKYLKQGSGYFDLGQFNEAEDSFNKILAIDPHNPDARRWLEKTEHEIDNYLVSARDHTRAHMLRMVDEIWETGVPRGTTNRAADKAERREQLQRFYRKQEPTQEWAENNYYQLRSSDTKTELISVNAFWKDYAACDGKGGFLSTNLLEASGNFTEILCALAVLDLPFPSEATTAKSSLKDNTLTLTPAHGTLLFRRALKPADMAAEGKLLVRQSFFRADDRWNENGQEKELKRVTKEFLTGVVYGCEVMITNPTANHQTTEVLLQIPLGALPVLGGKATANVPLHIEAGSAAVQEHYFYFPQPGTYQHFPVHVCQGETVLASAPATSFKVVRELSDLDQTSWLYVSQMGTAEQVLEFIAKRNCQGLDLSQIAWRCQDAAFFAKLIPALEERRLYDDTIWSYGIKHNVPEVMREYLLGQADFLNGCGPAMESKLLVIDPVALKNYEHLEYSPLVNARAHRMGSKPVVLNDALGKQYAALLNVLAHQRELRAEDRLAVTYYLLLQDRVDEALDMLNGGSALPRATPEPSQQQKKGDAQQRITTDDVAERLQMDYLQAVLAWQQADTKTARALATLHITEPVDHWREKFQEVLAQLDELEGGKTEAMKADSREQQQNQLAASEPHLEFKMEGTNVALKYQKLTTVTVNYYAMDLEFLFSAAPFVSSDPARFSLIQPSKTETLQLAADQTTHRFALPKEYHHANVLVEITGGGKKQAQAHFANELEVNLSQAQGRLQVLAAEGSGGAPVTDKGSEGAPSTKGHRPLSKVYVKVYAEVNGTPQFHKDGYTDLRGKFDYVSVSTPTAGITRYSLLIMSEQHGATVREVAPPQE